jgi:hypothetical protein
MTIPIGYKTVGNGFSVRYTPDEITSTPYAVRCETWGTRYLFADEQSAYSAASAMSPVCGCGEHPRTKHYVERNGYIASETSFGTYDIVCPNNLETWCVGTSYAYALDAMVSIQLCVCERHAF